jgi:SAM-dependent methyltransferase
MTPYHESDGVTLYHGDCLQVLRALSDESIDAIVTDPPYGLSFMGKRWDYDVPSVEIWAECLRVLKPGGHLLAFAGTRTQHRMAVRIENAGFEIRDMIAWVYGSGFPKSLDVSKAIDKVNGETGRLLKFTQWFRTAGVSRSEATAAMVNAGHISKNGTMAGHYYANTASGQPAIPTRAIWATLRPLCGEVPAWVDELVNRIAAEREVVGKNQWTNSAAHFVPGENHAERVNLEITAPATPEAQQWAGWGTALKPALEPITMARKPLIGTVAENVLTHGTGGLNVDGCRAGTEEALQGSTVRNDIRGGAFAAGHKPNPGDIPAFQQNPAGRWPANLIHDGSDEVAGLFPQGSFNKPAMWQSDGDGADGTRALGKGVGRRTAGTVRDAYGDTGSAARFFYCAKASKRDRGESNRHPTVKPTALMRYLCRLLTPPGGLVLDPFTGSGSTGRGAVLEGFRFVGMELDAEHIGEAKRRILEVQNGWTDEPEDEPAEDLPGQRLLF